MKNIDFLKKAERCALVLAKLYDGYGYKKCRVSCFEEYGVYLSNKNLLNSDNVITTSSSDGRLLALKPDVTLSIVKNTLASKDPIDKLYYEESVYRAARGGEFHEIKQTGVEVIGEIDRITRFELVDLALKSLAVIDDDFVLDMSHIGFVSGLVKYFGVDGETQDKLYDLLRSRSLHGLKQLVDKGILSKENAEIFSKLVKVNAVASLALEEISCLICNEEMQVAFDEMKKLADDIALLENKEKLHIDFSIVTDMAYYNGLVFQGFASRAARAVLTGGQYDLLVQRLGGKNKGALGFALYLDEVEDYDSRPIDVILLYDDNSDVETLTRELARLRAGGTVRAAKYPPENAAYRRLMKLTDNGAVEVKNA